MGSMGGGGDGGRGQGTLTLTWLYTSLKLYLSLAALRMYVCIFYQPNVCMYIYFIRQTLKVSVS